MVFSGPERLSKEPEYYYSDLNEIEGADGVWDLADRLPEVQQHADIRSDDQVLDVGCAEGLITMALADACAEATGIDRLGHRVAAARLIAQRRGIENVRFETGSITEIALAERSYDVVAFLGVFQHLTREQKWPCLTNVMNAAKRSVLFRTPIFHAEAPQRATRLAKICCQLNFSLTIYPRLEPRGGSFMILNRMGD